MEAYPVDESTCCAEQLLKRYKDLIERHLDSLTVELGCAPPLGEAMTYALDGGKRLRGAILLSFFETLGGHVTDALNFAAAMEMIHGYSLVHDDLPCMDNDDFRRGKPSCHRAFGYSMALLAGDALLTLAFEIAASSPGLPPQAVVNGIIALSRAAGPSGMVGGQVLDLALEGKMGSPLHVREMYRMKTGALFGAAARTGALLAGGGSDEVESADKWGTLFGYAFQVADDLDDLAQGGKEEDKDTLAKETSPETACKEAEEALQSSLAALGVFGGRATLAEGLSRLYLRRCREMSRTLATDKR